jgi:hypothetical protein
VDEGDARNYRRDTYGRPEKRLLIISVEREREEGEGGEEGRELKGHFICI